MPSHINPAAQAAASLAPSLSPKSKILTNPREEEFESSMVRWSNLHLQTPSAIFKPATEADVQSIASHPWLCSLGGETNKIRCNMHPRTKSHSSPSLAAAAPGRLSAKKDGSWISQEAQRGPLVRPFLPSYPYWWRRGIHPLYARWRLVHFIGYVRYGR